jgi:hypothetical protein
MKCLGTCLHSLTFLFIIFASCQKENVPELKSRILFSVDLNNQKFDPYYRETYLAAYTTKGKLINYGSLSDSANWELKGECKEDKIDILYFEIGNKSSLSIDHIRNVNIGQSIQDTNKFENNPSLQDIRFTLKVEDFGNYNGNSTGLNVFEMIPHKFMRGYSYSGEFDWGNIENGYAYKSSYISFDPGYQGTELLIFERSTNKPYVYYLDFPATELNSEDTITLDKSDFKPGKLETIQVNSSDNEFDNIFLYTYNTINGKKDLITSFDQLIPNPSGEKYINYITSDILPINYWEFKYFASISGASSYTIRSNKEIPSLLEVKELTGQKITMSGNQFNFTHSNIFPDKKLARSTIQFSKTDCNAFLYSLHFDGSETIGNTTITPFEIPQEILAKYPDFLEINSLEWIKYRYSHTYTNIPNNSPLDFLINSRLNWIDNNSSTDDYTYEVFTINL